MNRYLIITLFLGVNCLTVRGDGSPPLDCPNTPLAWETLRKKITEEIDKELPNRVKKAEACLVNAPHTIAHCMERLVDYGKYAGHFGRDKKDPYSLGLKVSNAEYFRLAQKYLKPPDDLQEEKFLKKLQQPMPDPYVDLPKFKKSIAEYTNYLQTFVGEWNQRRASLGLPPVKWAFHTAVTPLLNHTEHKNLIRLVFLVPGDPKDPGRRDVLLQFAPGSHVASEFAMLRQPDGNWRTYPSDLTLEREKKLEIKVPQESLGSENCRVCHTSFRPYPLNEKSGVGRRFPKEIAEINKVIGDYHTSPNEFEYPVPPDLPSVGEILEEDVIAECIDPEIAKMGFKPVVQNHVTQFTRQKIASAVNCVVCHTGKPGQEGKLVPPLRRPSMHVVETGAMPSSQAAKSFTDDQAKMLADCLWRSYFGTTGKNGKFIPGTLQKYLTEVACLPASGSPHTPFAPEDFSVPDHEGSETK